MDRADNFAVLLPLPPLIPDFSGYHGWGITTSEWESPGNGPGVGHGGKRVRIVHFDAIEPNPQGDRM